MRKIHNAPKEGSVDRDVAKRAVQHVCEKRTEETGWVIEKELTKDGPLYLCTDMVGRRRSACGIYTRGQSHFVFSRDNAKAIRFARKEDAERICEALFLAFKWDIFPTEGNYPKAVEHMWMDDEEPTNERTHQNEHPSGEL